jgi:hypothetical protein
VGFFWGAPVRGAPQLKADPELAHAAITVDTKRLWPVVFLNDWLAKHQGQNILPRSVAPKQLQKKF